MSVASHLGIRVAEYDRKIRTFIPFYEEMLSVGAAALRPSRPSPRIVDLGTGTGALASCCLAEVPGARLLGLDMDADMLGIAARRLRAKKNVELARRSFSRGPLPNTDYFTAALSLHHVKTRPAKTRLYQRCFEALRPGGALVSVDCMPPASPLLRRIAHEEWTRHMERSYPLQEVEGYFSAWAKEDKDFPLDQELSMLATAGFQVDVVWRRGAFGVVRASKPRSRPWR